MARKDLTRPNESAAQKYTRLNSWYDTADSEIEGLADWDIKRDAFCEVLLRMLGDGLAVWLGLTKDEDALVISLVDGMKKKRTFVRDSTEWDDFWIARLQAYEAQQKRALRAPGGGEGEKQAAD